MLRALKHFPRIVSWNELQRAAGLCWKARAPIEMYMRSPRLSHFAVRWHPAMFFGLRGCYMSFFTVRWAMRSVTALKQYVLHLSCILTFKSFMKTKTVTPWIFHRAGLQWSSENSWKTPPTAKGLNSFQRGKLGTDKLLINRFLQFHYSAITELCSDRCTLQHFLIKIIWKIIKWHVLDALNLWKGCITCGWVTLVGRNSLAGTSAAYYALRLNLFFIPHHFV